ncbi:MAG: hypothetical protein V3T84_16325 [Phycisphaerales bacterium]
MLRLKLGFWPPSHLLHHLWTLGFYRLAGFRRRLDAIEALSAGNIVDVARGQCTRTMPDVAIERLEEAFTFVGIVEQFDESLVLLRRMLNWRGCYYVASNVTKRRRRTQRVL